MYSSKHEDLSLSTITHYNPIIILLLLYSIKKKTYHCLNTNLKRFYIEYQQ